MAAKPQEIPAGSSLKSAWTIAVTGRMMSSIVILSQRTPETAPALERIKRLQAWRFFLSALPSVGDNMSDRLLEGFNAIRATSEFLEFKAKDLPAGNLPDEILVKRFVTELIFPSQIKFNSQAYPIDAVQKFLTALGFDIGRPETREALQQKLVTEILATHEGIAAMSTISYINQYLATEQPRSMDAWK